MSGGRDQGNNKYIDHICDSLSKLYKKFVSELYKKLRKSHELGWVAMEHVNKPTCIIIILIILEHRFVAKESAYLSVIYQLQYMMQI